MLTRQMLPAIDDAIGAGTLVCQTQGNAQGQMSARLLGISDVALQSDVLASPGILREAPGLDGALDWTRQPQTKMRAAVRDRIALELEVGGFEGNPAERTLPTPPLQLDLLPLCASCHLFGAHLLDRLRRQSQVFGRASRQLGHGIRRQKRLGSAKR